MLTVVVPAPRCLSHSKKLARCSDCMAELAARHA